MTTSNEVNSQVTDAITQTGVSVVAGAAAQSMGLLYQVMAQSTGLLMQNAVTSQGSFQQLNTALVATACREIMAVPQMTQSQGAPPSSVNMHIVYKGDEKTTWADASSGVPTEPVPTRETQSPEFPSVSPRNEETDTVTELSTDESVESTFTEESGSSPSES